MKESPVYRNPSTSINSINEMPSALQSADSVLTLASVSPNSTLDNCLYSISAIWASFSIDNFRSVRRCLTLSPIALITCSSRMCFTKQGATQFKFFLCSILHILVFVIYICIIVNITLFSNHKTTKIRTWNAPRIWKPLFRN